MKNLCVVIIIFLTSIGDLFSIERTDKEIEIGVFREDLKDIGNFKKIEKAPDELFEKKYNSFQSRQVYSLEQIGKIFVKQRDFLKNILRE